MPGRSPHRRSPPPPPLISRHSPSRGRVRSPDRHLEMASSSRGRERREFKTAVRRSRSPIPTKVRSFSPPMKRKASPTREREMVRRTKISKSPVGSRVGSEHGSYSAVVAESDSHTIRTVSGSERFREREYEGERERALPQFRGPEGSVNFDINELKKFTIEIIRKPNNTNDDTLINRNIINPDDIVPVRRPDSYAEDYHYYNNGRGKGMRGTESHRGHQINNPHLPPQRWTNHEDESYPFNHQNEGARPLFLRAEASASSSKDRSIPPEDYRRIVAIDPSRGTGTQRERSRERVRYSPVPYESSRRPFYPERERSPAYESRRRSPPREEYVEPRDIKPRERRAGSREDLRRDLDVRRREERRFSPEKRRSYERDSDLRTRIIEKRSEPHSRPEEREHSSRRYESERERERHGRPHHSPPPQPRERRRGGSMDRHEGSRSSRGEAWEREKEKESGGERRRRPHSREREERSRDRYEHYEDPRRSHPYKTEFEPKRYYKNYDEKEYVPPPNRGRGIPSVRRGVPPIIRGRGIVRGINRGFRGGMMGGMIRGVPRAPFMGMRGFPPRFFPPPY